MRHATSGSPELVPVPINSTSVVTGPSDLAVIDGGRGLSERKGKKRQSKLRSVIIAVIIKNTASAMSVVTMDLCYPSQKPLASLVPVPSLVVGRLAAANCHMPVHATVHHPCPRHERSYFAST